MLTSLATALALLTLTGCENPLEGIFSKTPEVYIPAGKCMEIRSGCKIPGWKTGADGKAEKVFYRAYPGCNVGPGVPSVGVIQPVAKESAVK